MGIELYPQALYDPELGGDVDHICNEIHSAFSGWGSDKGRLLKVVGSLTPSQRCEVPIKYQEMFKEELKHRMKSAVGSGDFGETLQLLSVNPVDAECLMIEKAVDGFLGVKEKVLIPIISGRSNNDLDLLKKKYFEICSKDLGQVLSSELKGALKDLIVDVLQADEEVHDPDYHTDERAEQDAEKLHKYANGWFGMDKKDFFNIMVKSPGPYLKKIYLIYADKYGVTLSKVLEKELGGDTEQAAEIVLGMKIKPYETIAGFIDEAFRGFGTNDFLLTTVLIRYQPVLQEVNLHHLELYGKSIADRVKSETGGDFRAILEKVVATGMNL